MLIIISVGAIFFSLFFIIFALDSLINGHDLPTSQRAIKVIAQIITAHKPQGIFYDLGCARGGLVVKIKKEFPGLTVRAIDKNPVRIFFSKARAFFLRQKVFFQKKDIFETNLSQADIVYAYLWYDLLLALEEKCRRELKKEALVITNTSHFAHWPPTQVIPTHPAVSALPDFETLFVYRQE